MIPTAEKAKVKLMIGQVLRFWPEYIKLKEIYDSARAARDSFDTLISSPLMFFKGFVNFFD